MVTKIAQIEEVDLKDLLKACAVAFRPLVYLLGYFTPFIMLILLFSISIPSMDSFFKLLMFMHLDRGFYFLGILPYALGLSINSYLMCLSKKRWYLNFLVLGSQTILLNIYLWNLFLTPDSDMSFLSLKYQKETSQEMLIWLPIYSLSGSFIASSNPIRLILSKIAIWYQNQFIKRKY